MATIMPGRQQYHNERKQGDRNAIDFRSPPSFEHRRRFSPLTLRASCGPEQLQQVSIQHVIEAIANTDIAACGRIAMHQSKDHTDPRSPMVSCSSGLSWSGGCRPGPSAG